MALYKISMTVDAKQKPSVEAALRKAFGGEVPIHSTEKLTGPESRADRLSEAEALADDARGIVEELKDEMEQWKDSIPENLQGGDKYGEVEEAANALEELQSNLESCDFGSISFPGMF